MIKFTRAGLILAAAVLLQVSIVAAHHSPGHGGGPGGPTPTPEPTAEPTPTPEGGGGTLGDMHLSFVTVTYGSTQDTYGTCKAGVVDSSGAFVDGAEVTFDVTDPWAGQYTAITKEQTAGLGNIYARVEFRLNKKNSCGKRGVPTEWTCTIVDVTHFDYTYAPELNVASGGTDSCLDGPVGMDHALAPVAADGRQHFGLQ